ncbi:MAG: hypothetical protein ACKOA4_06895 [Haliscomenobacter sp.]
MYCKLAYLALFACLTLRLAAQTVVGNQYNELTVQALAGSGGLAPVATAFDNRYEGVRGTPLLFETWKEGTLKIKGNDRLIGPIKLNIDLEKQIAAVSYQNGSLSILPGDKLEYLAFESAEGPQRFLALPEQVVDPASRGTGIRFYEVLYEGRRFVFLKDRTREFKKADFKGAYSSQVPYDEYVEGTHYFLRHGEEPFVKTKLRATAIEKQLAAWGRALPKALSGADLNTEAGIAKALKALEQE